MADAVKDGAGNTIIPASAAGNRGMDAQTPFYVRNVNGAGADVITSPSTPAAQSAAVNSSTATSDASGMVAANTNVVPLAPNTARQLLVISNTGANVMLARFGGAATATVGHPIAPGATLVLDSKAPAGAVNLFSTAGTTYTITQG